MPKKEPIANICYKIFVFDLDCKKNIAPLFRSKNILVGYVLFSVIKTEYF